MFEAVALALLVAGAFFSSSTAAADSGNLVEREMAKIFRGKDKTFGGLHFTQASLLAGVAAVGLKSWVECLRLQALCKVGLMARFCARSRRGQASSRQRSTCGFKIK